FRSSRAKGCEGDMDVIQFVDDIAPMGLVFFIPHAQIERGQSIFATLFYVPEQKSPPRAKRHKFIVGVGREVSIYAAVMDSRALHSPCFAIDRKFHHLQKRFFHACGTFKELMEKVLNPRSGEAVGLSLLCKPLALLHKKEIEG